MPNRDHEKPSPKELKKALKELAKNKPAVAKSFKAAKKGKYVEA